MGYQGQETLRLEGSIRQRFWESEFLGLQSWVNLGPPLG